MNVKKHYKENFLCNAFLILRKSKSMKWQILYTFGPQNF